MSVLLRNGTTVEDPRLDRLPPVDWTHVERYPLTLATIPEVPRPMVMGVNWYDGCDNPTKITLRGRELNIIRADSLRRIRGGHAVPLFAWNAFHDRHAWWDYYNQGMEGRCVEFAWLRVLTMFNRKRYDITTRWHYFEMQKRDYWPGGSYPGAVPQYEGTSVDAGAQVFHQLGAIPRWRNTWMHLVPPETLVKPEEGIGTYRWARDWADVRSVAGVPPWYPGVPMGNNWGRSYPRVTILEDAAGERLLREDGEFCVVTDR